MNGTTRLMKNIMGLWIIQECKRDWDRKGRKYSFAEIAAMAENGNCSSRSSTWTIPNSWRPVICPTVVEYCRRTGQAVLETDAQIARIVFEGLALAYRKAVESPERDMLGHKVDALNIVAAAARTCCLTASPRPRWASP